MYWRKKGVRALPCTDLLPGAAERKMDGHLLLGATWDDLGIDGSGGEGLLSYAGDGWRLSDGSLGGGEE